ncbi:MAG: molybdenum cofactor guanylyltransferase, partial [Planctomycetota bacterium]
MTRGDSVSAGPHRSKQAGSGASSVAGVVLCGGESRRMGRPKPWLPFGRQTLLQRVVDILTPVTERVVVVAAPGQELPPLPEAVTVLRDVVPRRGPLGGLATAFEALCGTVRWAFVTGCDTPLLRPELVRLLLEEAAAGNTAIVMPADGTRLHPLCAVYDVAATLPHVVRLLTAERLRPVFLTESCRTLRMPLERLRCADPELDSFCNANTPEAYEAVLQRA